MKFVAYCPICKARVVGAVLRHGSSANLENGEGEVGLAHSTGNPCEGDHEWVVTDAQDLADLKSSYKLSKAASAVR
jgi:hypothetical protein